MIWSSDEAKTQIDHWKDVGETVVFTNGCFDILHAGHVTYLEKAKSFGTKLIVGLNTDSSVQKLKGEGRPIQTERNRATIIDALKSVDAVILFDEDTPLNLIKLLNPDILVKGGDYTLDTVVGSKEVIQNGGSIEIIPLVEGCSTSNIVSKVLAGGKSH